MGSNPHAGHRERMRQRFLREGADGFADHELLEMLLYGMIPRGDVNEAAHELLATFGSLQNLLAADPYEIAKLRGIGLNTGVFFSLIHELIRRYESEKIEKRKALLSLPAVAEFCVALASNCLKERFYLICLDARRNVLHSALISEGSLMGSAVLPRDVVEAAMRHRAASVIFCHNHPIGGAYPSNDDIRLTLELKRLLHALEIQVVDHVIVAEHSHFSFAENGMMRQDTMEKYLLRVSDEVR